ncbi:MAG: hypothetical protein GX279_02280 [Clostridiaceae bacterium]|jgi:hypothetical protein|nr:hypothetical protein [Clostridiaceae bacterium]
MYNYFNRHYIFRRSDGEMRDIFCDGRQNLCSSRLNGKNGLPDSIVIARNVHPYFYAELDEHNVYHVVFQDNEGNINYIYMDGQWSKAMPVLGSKTPAVYNKQLYIAPLKNSIYIFYVLQHDNSFLLAYQTASKNKASTPKIVDYVSGSNIPCSLIYDQNENIYAFYQSYDGKYLQLGYKKMDTARKHWSDFISVTKFMGNCEYPHAIIDANGTIHLCYQRRTQKQYELVYQQKGRDKNLWSAETVLHSSVYPFENYSVVQTKDKTTVYWIRDDVIYYVAAMLNSDVWSRPARYVSQPGRQLQCICWKEQNSPVVQDRQGSSSSAASQTPSPGIFPGTLSNGVRLAFLDTPVSKAGPQLSLAEPSGRETGTYSEDMRDRAMSLLKELQEDINEISTGWSGTKKELARMTNAYMDMSRELGKLSLRLNLVENKLKEISNPYKSAVVIAEDKASESTAMPEQGSAPDVNKSGLETRSSLSEGLPKPSENPGLSLDPEARKIWEEWQEPKEWSEGS